MWFAREFRGLKAPAPSESLPPKRSLDGAPGGFGASPQGASAEMWFAREFRGLKAPAPSESLPPKRSLDEAPGGFGASPQGASAVGGVQHPTGAEAADH
jgi:hypothetical protein